MVDNGRPFITELASGEHRFGVGSGKITTHHIEPGKHQAVFDNYRTVAGRVIGKAFSTPSVSRGQSLSTTGATPYWHPS